MYRTQSSDTSLDAERFLFAAYRRMPSWEKLRRVSELTRATHELACAGLRERHPEASEEEIRIQLAVLLLGRDLVDHVLAARKASR